MSVRRELLVAVIVSAVLSSAISIGIMQLGSEDAVAGGATLSRILNEENDTQVRLAKLDKQVKEIAGSLAKVRYAVGTDAVFDTHKGPYLLLTGIYQCVVHSAQCTG